MKKINVFRAMMAVIVFTVLSSALSGCFYSPYGYGRPYAYNRPYRRVYAPPPPPPVRYQSYHRHYYDRGYNYNNNRGRSYGHDRGHSRGHRR